MNQVSELMELNRKLDRVVVALESIAESLNRLTAPREVASANAVVGGVVHTQYSYSRELHPVTMPGDKVIK